MTDTGGRFALDSCTAFGRTDPMKNTECGIEGYLQVLAVDLRKAEHRMLGPLTPISLSDYALSDEPVPSMAIKRVHLRKNVKHGSAQWCGFK